MGEPLTLFPIQLRRVGIGEITFQCPIFGQTGVALGDKVDITTGVGPYDTNGKTLLVLLTASSSGEPEVPVPHTLKVTVVGEFHVLDEAKLPFPVEKIPQWAERNGSMVLLPFLRELVFSITQRTGFQPFMIPLVEVKAFKVMPPDVTQPAQSAALGASDPTKSSP